MNSTQRLQLRQSEQREAINALLGTAPDDRADNHDSELRRLTDEAKATEVELRAALVAGDGTETRITTEDAEARERRELRGKASFGRFLLAALTGQTVAGAEAEYRAAHGVLDVGQWPIDSWEADRPETQHGARVEERAVTVSPAAGTGTTVAPVQPFVYAPSIAPMLGVDMPSVPSGAYSEMTISTALTPGPKAKGGAADGTAAALTAATAAPRRIPARVSLALEDIAAIGTASFEAALRSHVSMALSNAADNQILNGNGSSPNINGLINQLTDPSNPTSAADFDAFVRSFSDQIDGLWASTMKDVGIVTNPDAFKLAARTFRGTAANGGPALTAADYLGTAAGRFWTNKRMPATASTIARGIVHRMGRMGMRTACLPTWGVISVDDIYSNAAEGQRHFTVSSLVGDKVLLVQPDAYSLVEYKVS